MRAIHILKTCNVFRLQNTRALPGLCVTRQFHSGSLRRDEAGEVEIPVPRKRGRPKKVKTEDATAVTIDPAGTITAEPVVPAKPAKPKRKAPKISDITRLIPPMPLDPPPSRPLRPYQEECVDAVLTAIAEGKRRLGISLATGAGKTVIFTNLVGKVELEDSKRYQTLILVHRRELVEQAARHCVEVYPDKTVEIEMSNFHGSGTADITVCSVQSLLRSDRLGKFNPDWVKLILIDEAHHAAAPTYLKILDYFGASSKESKAVVVGVSATLSRLDGLRLGTALDEIVYHRDYIEMIGEKWLSAVRFTTVQTDIDLRQVRNNKFGDFSTSQLSRVVNTTNANEVTVRAWLDRAQSERRSTLVFCVDLEHVRDMTNTFRQYGVDARFITSKTQTTDRHTLIQQFRNGEYPVLVNCGIFTEGTDIPNIDCILLARPTRSRNLMVQMIGRGMRLSPGKKDCHVIDMVGSVKTHGVVTTPTLFGLDPTEVVSEESADALRQRAEDWKRIRELEKEEMIRNDPMMSGIAQSITYTDWDSVQSLLDDVTDLHIRQMSRLSWVYVGDYKHMLSIPRHGFLRVDKAPDGTFFCTETREIPSYPSQSSGGKTAKYLAQPRVLFDSLLSLDHAISAADTYANSRFPHTLISRDAMWRNGAATTEQIKFVNKFKSDGHKYDLPGEHRTGRSLTKGAAGDFITRVRHGGKGLYEKSKKKQMKVEKEMEKIEKVRRAETVEVGAIA